MKTSLSIVVLVFLAAGCSSTPRSEITFSQPEKRASVYQQFPGAYITSNRDGEYDIVLVNDTLRAVEKQRSSRKPLQPLNQPPIQQAIHIHVFWRPVLGAMVKESSITNAIVHWYVFGTEGSRGTDMVHYEGAAFVTLTSDDKTAHIKIGDGQIAARTVKGDLRDPVGPSRITGNILAIRNDSRVRELISAFQSKATGEPPVWTQAETDGDSAFGK